MIPCLKKFNWFRGLVNAKTKGNCQKLKKKKAAAVGRPTYFWRDKFEWAQGVWWSQVMHLMHLNIVSLACRFCILVANLIFLESQILLSSAREDYSLEIPQTKEWIIFAIHSVLNFKIFLQKPDQHLIFINMFFQLCRILLFLMLGFCNRPICFLHRYHCAINYVWMCGNQMTCRN